MIVLQILKIIGIILLVIIGIILLCACLILFCPVMYKVNGKSDEELYLKAKASWLFNIFAVNAEYINGEMSYYFRVLWLKIYSSDDSDEGDDSDEADDLDEDYSDDFVEEIDEVEEADEDSFTNSDEAEPTNENTVECKAEVEEEVHEEGQEAAEEEKTEDSEEHSKRKAKKKAKKKLAGIKDIKHKLKKWIRFIKNPRHKKAFEILKTEFVNLLKAISPKRFKLDMRFSAGSPDLTGQALGIFAMFPMMYKNRWKIYPDFEADKAYAKGSLYIFGHMLAYKLIFIFMRVFLDKNCRKLYNDFKK